MANNLSPSSTDVMEPGSLNHPEPSGSHRTAMGLHYIHINYIFLYKIPYTLHYVVQVAVNYSYCTPDDGYGKYPKHVE
jgi:hypothetical protein